jgi:DNA polymerase III gamma/tau subunit
LLVTKVSGSEELLESAICDRDELKRQAALFSEAPIWCASFIRSRKRKRFEDAAHPRYQLEIGLVKLMEMRKTPQATPASNNPNNPPDNSTPRASSAGSSRSTKASAEPEAAEPAPVVTPKAADSFIGQVKSRLEQKRRRLLIAAIEAALRAELEADELVVEFSAEAKHYRDTLARTDNAKALREACAEVCGREIGIRFVIKNGAETNVPAVEEDPQAKQKARHAVAQDPAVQQVLRAFGAQIVDIKPQ